MRGGARTIVEPHDRFSGVYILRGKDDALVTRNIAPGESVYNEKRVSVDVKIPKFSFIISYRSKKERRLNIECGTPSDQSSQQLLSEVSKTFTCNQAVKSFI